MPGRDLGRVLNLKVKPPPLLPNPCAEREGCSASTSHSTDLNSSRASNSSIALFRCFKAPVVCRLNDTAFSSGNITAGFNAICQERSPICKLRLSDALYSIYHITLEYMITPGRWKKGTPLSVC